MLANCFTFALGTSQDHCTSRPLFDVLHNLLPDMSKWVYSRDIILLAFLIPLLWIHNKRIFILELWDKFMLVVLCKAICIFFTFIPPSNPDCAKKKYINHCFHNAVSGHAAFAIMLAWMYKKNGVFGNTIYVFVAAYCLLILMTRAHYTKDIFEAIIICFLILFE